MNRRSWLPVAGCALLLSGCASGQSTSTWGQYYEVLKQSFSGSFGDKSVSLEQAAKIEYASLGYRLNGGPENLIVLATDAQGDQLWTSAAHIVLVTQGGRIKRTVGLPHDLATLTPARGPALPSPAQALKGEFNATLSADFPDVGLYNASITCRLAVAGPETTRILGQAIATTRVDEDCNSAGLRWQFRNSYWLDADGFVWRSVQHIHPGGDWLDIEIFRPPG